MASTYDELVQRGYRWVLVAEVEGVPYLFAEHDPDRIDADAKPTLPASVTALSESLLILPSQTIGIQIDRETGYAQGDAWDMVLSRAALVEEGLQSTLFIRPSYTGILAADVAAGDTTIQVDDVTGASSPLNLGRELFSYSGTSGGDTFTGVTRGVLGYAYDFDAGNPGAYREVTDVPKIWRGRWVTLHAHLLSPAGHMLDSTWLTGTYHRIVWRGYIDSPPRPSEPGMVLRCLPLIRILGRDLGSGITGTVRSAPTIVHEQAYQEQIAQRAEFDDWPLYVTPTATLTIYIAVDNSGITEATTVAAPVSADTVLTVGQWRGLLIAAIDTAWSAQAWFDSVYDGGQYPLDVRIRLASGYTWEGLQTTPGPGCYWLHGDIQEHWYYDGGVSDYIGQINAGLYLWDDGYVAVSQLEGLGLLDQQIPSSGYGVLTQGDREELFAWDAADTTLTGVALLRVQARAMNGVKLLLAAGGKFEVAIGDVGSPGEVIRRVLTSSGTTLRGSDDTLATGYALDGDWVPSTAVPDALPGGSQPVTLLGTGRQAFGDVIGGWLALAGKALVQRRDSAGELVIAVVGSTTTNDVLGTTITAADIEVTGARLPALADGPTGVEIDTAGVGANNEEATVLVGAQQVMLAEGARIWSLSAPGIDPVASAQLGAALVARLGGETLVELPIAPWVAVQPGDPVTITAQHPLIYDWDNGDWSLASVPGRVLGVRPNLHTGAQLATILVAGAGDGATLTLCPTADIFTKNSTSDFVLNSGEGVHFIAGDSIQFYTAGNEAAEKETRVIDTVTDDNITITVAASAWVGVGTKVTYPAHGSATSAQKDSFVYVRSDKQWEG